MVNATGDHRRQPRRRERSEPLDAFSSAAVEDLRIARSLIGTTPTQLAAYIGAQPDPRASSTGAPVLNLDTLAAALRTVIGWYHTTRGTTPAADPAAGLQLSSLDALVRRYLNLRSEWESREARLLTAQLTGNVRVRPKLASRRALLVDDASDILITVGAFLEVSDQDFEVVRASNADTALALLANGRPFNLLVTDHAMPGMTGCDLAFQACQLYPALRALIITGYPGDDQLAALPSGVAVLAKPFRRVELFEQIRLLFAPNDTTRLVAAAQPG